MLPLWLKNLVANVGLAAALEMTYEQTYHWTNPHIWEELAAIANTTGVDYMKIGRIHMLPGFQKGACSMLGAWGEALLQGTGSTNLLQLRALDWDMDGPFRDHNQITVYHSSDPMYGHDHVLVGYTCFIGGLTGMSKTQLGISEIGVSYKDPTFGEQSDTGVPFVWVLRDILQYDITLQDSISRMKNQKRTCDLILGVGDGKTSEFRGFEYSYAVLDVLDDTNLRPANDTWHPKIKNVVYWGMDWVCPSFNFVLSSLINKHHGQISAEVAVHEISASEASGSNQVAYYDLTNMLMYVSMAASHTEGGNPNAYARQYTKVDVNALFAEKM